MKIAIMTQPLGRNFGGMMQAFALQRKLSQMGHEVRTIDRYSVVNKNYRYYARIIYNSLLKLLGKRKSPVNINKHIDYIFSSGRYFVKNNINVSESIFDNNQLVNHFKENAYDVTIVGSDQTWRPRYSPNIYNYYLDFLESNSKIRKISYASSFGVDYWEYSSEETAKCKSLVQRFDAVSVREESGINLCREYLNIDATCVLDPTLLLNKQDYISLLGDVNTKNEGVYTYWLDKSDEKLKLTHAVSSIMNTYNFKCQANNSLTDENVGNIDDFKMPKVTDWLSGFANAEFILTDSFHGMVFSIIFEKQFFVVVNKERGAARFESLLSKLGLLERMIDQPEKFYNFNSISKIDYSEVSARLAVLRESSIDFLSVSLR